MGIRVAPLHSVRRPNVHCDGRVLCPQGAIAKRIAPLHGSIGAIRLSPIAPYAALRLPFGAVGMAVPIMLSRVTSAASCSSLQPRVPLGRIGSTM